MRKIKPFYRKKKLLEIIEEKNQMIRSFEDTCPPVTSPIAKKDEALDQMTPASKTCAYIDQHLPNIRPEERESVKKVLLEHNVIVDTLKDCYKGKNTEVKRLMKDVFTKSDKINKYGMKTKMAAYLGLKGKIRHTKQKNKCPLIQTQLRFFYERDDVSRMTAGKNEIKTQKKTEKTEKVFTWHST